MPKAHRHGDKRACGAKTTVQNQSTVFVNNKLWAVENSYCNHGHGGLKHSGTTVFVENKLVIVHRPDHSRSNDRRVDKHHDPATAEGSPNVFAYK